MTRVSVAPQAAELRPPNKLNMRMRVMHADASMTDALAAKGVRARPSSGFECQNKTALRTAPTKPTRPYAMSIPATPDVPPATLVAGFPQRQSRSGTRLKLPSPHMLSRFVTEPMPTSVPPQVIANQGEPDKAAQVLRALPVSFDWRV